GSWLNRDQVMTQVAQASEQYERAEEAGHGALGFADQFAGWAGLAMTALSPTHNLLQGVYDATQGEGGDGVAEYRNSDTSSLPMQAIDTAALIADGVGSFGSKLAIKAFTVGMGAVTLGGVASTASGVAEGNLAFNPYSGRYEDIGAG